MVYLSGRAQKGMKNEEKQVLPSGFSDWVMAVRLTRIENTDELLLKGR